MKYNLNEEFEVLQERYLNEFYDANQMKFIERIQGKIDVAFMETSKAFGGLTKTVKNKVDVVIDYQNAYNKFINKMSNLYSGKSKVSKGVQHISFPDKISATKFYNMVKNGGEENGVSLQDLSAIKEEQKSRLIIFKDSFFVVEYKISKAILKSLTSYMNQDSFFKKYEYYGFYVDTGKALEIKIDDLIKKNASIDFWKAFNTDKENYSTGTFTGYGKEQPAGNVQPGSMMYSQGRRSSEGGYNSHSAPWD